MSLELGLTALAIATLLGVPLGLPAAANQNRRPGPRHRHAGDGRHRGTEPDSTAPLLTLVFGVMLKMLPVAGWGDGAWPNRLPLTALLLPQLAVIARLARGSHLDVRRQNFIRAARARGLPEWRVVLFHALPPTLVPLVSYLAPAVACVT